MLKTLLFSLLVIAGPAASAAAAETGALRPDLTATFYGYLGLALFVLAYALVIVEEKFHMRKSKPVMVAAGIIWVLVALAYAQIGDIHTAHAAIRENLVEYAELFLFLLAAMTYINSLEERNVFKALRGGLVSRGFSLRVIFWLTGLLAFFISPIADNLTTALLMGAVVMAVGRENKRFVVLSCINIVVAANAGGAFSPFGDITTLMVWQKGRVDFFEFFAIFVPALINWLIPAFIMSFAVGKEKPRPLEETVSMKYGARRIMLLFLLTIATAVCFHNFLHLPPAVGMMLGLGLLSLFSYHIKTREHRIYFETADNPLNLTGQNGEGAPGFDLFRKIAKAEWDTLLFFYGVILCVGGLGQFGYLALASHAMYTGIGATGANVLVGMLSAVIDNIPVMYAVLTMNPHMSHGQWLLVTLTAGVGGSLLSIGSAAGVGLMGTARGTYTFFRHLVWMPVIALGYAGAIVAHLIINAAHFTDFH